MQEWFCHKLVDMNNVVNPARRPSQFENRCIRASWLRFGLNATLLLGLFFCILSSYPIVWPVSLIVVLLVCEVFFFAAEQHLLVHSLSIPLAVCEQIVGTVSVNENTAYDSISDNPVVSYVARLQSQLREATVREQRIADYAIDVVLSLDESLEIVAINHSCQKSLSYTRTDLTGKSILGLVIEGQQNLQHAMGEAKATGKSQCADLRLSRGDGREVFVVCQVEWSATHLTYYCKLTDITARKLFELSRKEFVAMISHDLRSPLGNVMMTLEMIEEFELSSMTVRSKTLMKDCRQNVARLLALTEQLLDLEKYDTGNFKVTTEVNDAESMVRAAVRNVESLALSKDIVIKVSSPPLLVWADDSRIIQVLINLLSNSIKCSPPSTVVQVAVRPLGRSEVEFAVIDQGAGIPLSEQGKVFQRFPHIEGSGKSLRKESVGLGLVISKMLVEAHGGRIGFESKEGQGASFWFVLNSAME
jgi:PAS domain S-box-containing protein